MIVRICVFVFVVVIGFRVVFSLGYVFNKGEFVEWRMVGDSGDER